jgi:hypothetical protein
MPDAQEDLRATSEAIQDDAEQLAMLETQKRDLEPTNPEVVEMSRRIEELAQEMATKATVERELSEEIQRA